MKGTWQTTSGGSGMAILGAATFIIGAGYVLAKAPAALHAGSNLLADLAKLVIAATASIIALTATAYLGHRAYRRRRPAKPPAFTGTFRARVVPPQTSHHQVPNGNLNALPPPPARHQDIHLHFHGLDPEQVAAAIRNTQE